ncbi:MAG: hypothetical protein ABSA14_15340 [Acidimicrobiales bacterium]|jgi:hypothetical protein
MADRSTKHEVTPSLVSSGTSQARVRGSSVNALIVDALTSQIARVRKTRTSRTVLVDSSSVTGNS